MAMLMVASAPAAPVAAQRTAAGDALAAACGQLDPDAPMDSLSPTEQRVFVGCLLSKEAAAFKVNLPEKVDEITTLTDVTANGLIMTYHVTLSVAADEVPLAGVVRMRGSMRKGVCETEQMANLISAGGGFRYIWTDEDGIVIGETTIDSC